MSPIALPWLEIEVEFRRKMLLGNLGDGLSSAYLHYRPLQRVLASEQDEALDAPKDTQLWVGPDGVSTLRTHSERSQDAMSATNPAQLK